MNSALQCSVYPPFVQNRYGCRLMDSGYGRLTRALSPCRSTFSRCRKIIVINDDDDDDDDDDDWWRWMTAGIEADVVKLEVTVAGRVKLTARCRSVWTQTISTTAVHAAVHDQRPWIFHTWQTNVYCYYYSINSGQFAYLFINKFILGVQKQTEC